MTQPRMLDKKVYEVSQRTMLGWFRFIQTARVQQVILYAVARACKMSGAEVVSLVVMSTHIHVMICVEAPQDVETFTRELHSFLARCLNRMQRRIGQFWRSKRPQVTPIGANSVYDRIRYILCNPLRAFIARSWREHAGVILGPEDLNRTIVAECPYFALGKRTKAPATLVLPMAIPVEAVGDIDHEEFIARSNEIVDVGEAVIRAEHDRRIIRDRVLGTLAAHDFPSSGSEFRYRKGIGA